jgi:hypothetical protein
MNKHDRYRDTRPNRLGLANSLVSTALIALHHHPDRGRERLEAMVALARANLLLCCIYVPGPMKCTREKLKRARAALREYDRQERAGAAA